MYGLVEYFIAQEIAAQVDRDEPVDGTQPKAPQRAGLRHMLAKLRGETRAPAMQPAAGDALGFHAGGPDAECLT